MGHRSDKRTSLATDRQQGRISLRIGDRTHWSAEIDVSATGLISIGALVAMTLLSTAVLVRVASGRARSSG